MSTNMTGFGWFSEIFVFFVLWMNLASALVELIHVALTVSKVHMYNSNTDSN